MSGQEMRAVDYAREAALELPGSIRQVAEFLLAEGTGVGQMSMAEVATRSYTSKPTLVRFAKQAGYAGWTDYRRDFLVAMGAIEREQARASEVDVNYPFSSDATAAEVLDVLARIQRLAADEVAQRSDPASLGRAASLVVGARDVVCLGAMQNHQRVKTFAINLSLMGILCRTPASDELGPLLRTFGEGDCAVVASYSGSLSFAPMSLVPSLKKRGVSIVAITNAERGELRQVADCVLGFAPLEHLHDKMGSFYSGACTSMLLDALFAACQGLRYEEGSSARRSIVEGMRGHMPEEFH